MIGMKESSKERCRKKVQNIIQACVKVNIHKVDLANIHEGFQGEKIALLINEPYMR